MGLIINIRDRKWFLRGFLFITLALLTLGFVPAVYDIYQKNPGATAIIEGKFISKAMYDKKFKEIEKVYNGSDKSEIHQQTLKSLQKEQIVNKICQDAGIKITNKKAEETIASYNSTMQAVVKKINKPFHQKLMESKKPQELFIEYIKSKEGKYWLKQDNILEKVKEELKTQRALLLFSTSPHNQINSFLSEKKIRIEYFKVPLTGLEYQSINPTQKEREKFWTKHQSDKPNQKEKKVRFYTFVISPSSIEEKDSKEALENLRDPFEKSTNSSVFAQKNTETDSNHTQEWKYSEAPHYIRNLSKGQVSPVIQIDKNTLVIYKITDKPLLIAIFGGTIKAQKILKKIETNDHQEYTEQQAQKLYQALQKNTPWQKVMKQYGYTSQKEHIKDSMPTIVIKKSDVHIEKNDTKSQIALKVFKEKIRPGQPFLIQNRKDWIVGIVEYVKDSKDNKGKDINILREIINTEKITTLQQYINQQKSQEELIEKYGYIQIKTTQLNIANDHIGETYCPKEIAKILTQLTPGEYYCFQDKDSAIILKVTQEETSKEPPKINSNIIDQEAYLDTLIENRKNRNDTQDYRT